MVFIGINLAYVITHASPIDPVEQSISAVTSFGNTAPGCDRADAHLAARALRARRHAWSSSIVTFWSRVLRADFGPSLSAFPTPVSTLIGRALPWTVGLLIVSTLITWVLGNLLGGLAGYYQQKPQPEAHGRRRHGAAPDPLLHRRA